jgi:FkbM family methyltransferase
MRPLVKRLARSVGYEIRRYAPDSSERARLARLLAHHAIDLVLDVGANAGQYALELRGIGYRGAIVSFEPVAQAHAALARAAQSDPQWIVAPRLAIGDRAGEIELNVAENIVSSSVLAPSALSLAAAPASRASRVERAPMERLDEAAWPYLGLARRIYLKIDVQGYEPRVLEGARDILEHIHGIQLEMSLVPLYEGQALLWEVNRSLEGMGFCAHALMPGFSDPASGRLLQLDGVYFRR